MNGKNLSISNLIRRVCHSKWASFQLVECRQRALLNHLCSSLRVQTCQFVVCLFGFLTPSSVPGLSRGRVPRLRSDNVSFTCCHTETGRGDHVSANHITHVLTPIQPVGSGCLERRWSQRPPDQQSCALSTELTPPNKSRHKISYIKILHE